MRVGLRAVEWSVCSAALLDEYGGEDPEHDGGGDND